MRKIENIIDTIINDDSTKALSTIPKESIDMVITSPPYDDLRDYDGCNWNEETFKKIANGIKRVLKPGGVIVWVVGDAIVNGGRSLTSYKQALYFKTIGLTIYDVIIYQKAGSGPPHKNRYFNSFEYMFVISKGRPKTINLLNDKKNKWAGVSTYAEVTRREKDGSLAKKGKKIVNEYGVRTNVWEYVNGKGYTTKDKIAYEHPAIFPEKLVEDHLSSWSEAGDIILDPFGGSGTVAKVSRNMGRHWILIEISQKYCELAKERLEQTRIEK